MKLYRFVEKPLDEELLKEGWGNEYLNILNNIMSPSYHKCYFNKNFKELNSFNKTNELTKYFYSSLAETIIYAKYCQKKKYEMDIYCDYIIYEIDIPDDLIKDFIGVGYYFGDKKHIEYRMPYQLLYELLGIKEEYIMNSIKLYNDINNYENEIEYNDYINNNRILIEKIKEKGLSCEGGFELYPLLCFQLEDKLPMIKIDFNTSSYSGLIFISNFARELLREREFTHNYNSEIDKIVGSIDHNIKILPSFSQKELFMFSAPIIEKENKELKLMLKNSKYPFK